MKKLILLAVLITSLSGCSPSKPAESSPTDTTVQVTPPEPVAVSDNTVKYDLIVNDQSYGLEEIYAEQNTPLVISLRNQLQEPINITIDELGVRSEPVGFGQVIEVIIPTDEVGEFEMYSSIGNRKNPNFSAIVNIE